ncbi:N-acetyltransferase [Polaribacter pacificus]|uniref:N-acetyltransferase n=1 Tax=Polaribacter pacificus TaxID=1775173 RepID=A0A917MGH9_9FLAO|nr:GNAT family N-acetyltransferase [Polaribacter pacificus]GGH00432.1 N-acetyltransferase [Polaribacter pacificus]
MNTEAPFIRAIKVEDNEQIAKVIRAVLIEFGVPKVGTAYEDKALENLYNAYREENTIYYVIEHQGKVIGGAGIAPLANYEGPVCEFQKMYFLPEARGLGLGSKLIEKCLLKARSFGFEHCYLETLPYMEAARALYKKNGFVSLNKPLGDTGHYSCNMWMLKEL